LYFAEENMNLRYDTSSKCKIIPFKHDYKGTVLE